MNKRFKWMWRAALTASMLASASAWAADEDAYDFGGMYGLYPEGGVVKYYNNPATGSASCPTGYDARQVFGTGNVDWSMFLCTRPHLAGRAPLYDFGGMVGLANGSGNGALPWRGYYYFVNPFTHTHECPTGYQSQQVLGTPSVDHNLYYCYRPHTEGGLRMDFAGMTGDGATPYPNPATGVAHTCPGGYGRYTAFGTPSVDYTFYYCGKPRNANLQPAGKGSLGLGEPIVPDAVDNFRDDPVRQAAEIDAQVDLIKALRPRVVRMWMLNTHILVNENTLGPYAGLHRQAVDALAAANITMLGMDHSFPAWLTGVPERSGIWVLPCPDISSPNTPYRQFLARYERSWTTIAREYPQIKLWQPANETNGPNIFAPPSASQVGACPSTVTDPGGRTKFTDQDRVDITLDLMYYAKRGIKAGNPQATVFMPPPSPLGVKDLSPIKTFIKALYVDIANGRRQSSNARDYFDGVSWHPYILGDADQNSWIKTNNAIHDVLEDYGDGDLPVIFSEVGNSVKSCRDTNNDEKYDVCDSRSLEQLRDWMLNTLELSQSSDANAMPWLTYLIWFRMNDIYNASPGELSPEPFYGLFKGNDHVWSPSAYLFCAYTGCAAPEAIPF